MTTKRGKKSGADAGSGRTGKGASKKKGRGGKRSKAAASDAVKTAGVDKKKKRSRSSAKSKATKATKKSGASKGKVAKETAPKEPIAPAESDEPTTERAAMPDEGTAAAEEIAIALEDEAASTGASGPDATVLEAGLTEGAAEDATAEEPIHAAPDVGLAAEAEGGGERAGDEGEEAEDDDGHPTTRTSAALDDDEVLGQPDVDVIRPARRPRPAGHGAEEVGFRTDDSPLTEIDIEVEGDITPPVVRSDDFAPIIAALEEELDKSRDRLRALSRDFDRFRGRVREERTENRTKILVDIVQQLLPVLDNLQRAAAAPGNPDSPGDASLKLGVEMVQRQFEGVLRNLGVREVPAGGQHTFDPRVHDAFEVVHRPDLPDGAILDVVLRGFTLGERLIRPSRVRVSRRVEVQVPVVEDDEFAFDDEDGEPTQPDLDPDAVGA